MHSPEGPIGEGHQVVDVVPKFQVPVLVEKDFIPSSVVEADVSQEKVKLHLGRERAASSAHGKRGVEIIFLEFQ